MFTLKLYKGRNGQLVTRIMAVDHVQTMTIGPNDRLLELWAFEGREPSAYESVYIGDVDPNMDAVTEDNHWGWGLLENWEGNTTQHFRPAGYGLV